MTPAVPKHSAEEVARLGQEFYERVVRPRLTPADDGKLVAVDTASEEYEIDTDDVAVVKRLRERVPGAEIWLLRVGHAAVYMLRGFR